MWKWPNVRMVEGLGNSVQATIAYAIAVFAGNSSEEVLFFFVCLKTDGTRNNIFLNPNVFSPIVEVFSKDGSSQTTCACIANQGKTHF